MSGRILFVVLLLLSLLCAGLTLPQARVAVQNDASECVDMMCMKGCCPMKACCDSGQQQAPRPPESLAPRPELQLVAPSFHMFASVVVGPARTCDFITVDKRGGGYAPSPRARSCIRLI